MARLKLLKEYEGKAQGSVIEVDAKIAPDLVLRGIGRIDSGPVAPIDADPPATKPKAKKKA